MKNLVPETYIHSLINLVFAVKCITQNYEITKLHVLELQYTSVTIISQPTKDVTIMKVSL